MPELITQDDVDELEFEVVSGDDHDERLRARAAQFIDWASSDAYALEEDLTRAYLLTAAAEHLMNVGDLDAATSAAIRAGQQSDAEPFEAIPVLARIHLERGDRAAALALSDEVRRSRVAVPDVAEQLGELFEEDEQFDLAERWFTIGARQLAATGGARFRYSIMLTSRYRVRRFAGKPTDGVDEEAMELRSEFGFEAPDFGV